MHRPQDVLLKRQPADTDVVVASTSAVIAGAGVLVSVADDEVCTAARAPQKPGEQMLGLPSRCAQLPSAEMVRMRACARSHSASEMIRCDSSAWDIHSDFGRGCRCACQCPGP